jgi:hypothetical protein
MRLGDRIDDFRRAADEADLPAGQTEHLARRADLERPPGHARLGQQRAMGTAVEDHMLPHLVADRDQVATDAEPGHRRHLFGVEGAAGRIERVVEHQGPGLRPGGGLQQVGGDPPVRRAQSHPHGDPARPFDQGHIGVIDGLEDHDLVPGADNRQHRRGDGLRRARGDQHARGGQGDVLHPAIVFDHGGAQLGQAARRRVLVRPVDHSLGRQPPQVLRPRRIGKALAEVDGPVRPRQTRHGLEDGRRHGLEDGMKAHAPSGPHERPGFKPAGWAIGFL